jgi:anti-anti-sigma regulatory factor
MSGPDRAKPAGRPAGFSLAGNTLTVRSRLRPEDRAAFSSALQELLDTGHDELVIDLSGVQHMTSTHIAPIAKAMVAATKLGKRVVVSANKVVAFLLKVAGIDGLGDIRVATD